MSLLPPELTKHERRLIDQLKSEKQLNKDLLKSFAESRADLLRQVREAVLSVSVLDRDGAKVQSDIVAAIDKLAETTNEIRTS